MPLFLPATTSTSLSGILVSCTHFQEQQAGAEAPAVSHPARNGCHRTRRQVSADDAASRQKHASLRLQAPKSSKGRPHRLHSRSGAKTDTQALIARRPVEVRQNDKLASGVCRYARKWRRYGCKRQATSCLPCCLAVCCAYLHFTVLELDRIFLGARVKSGQNARIPNTCFVLSPTQAPEVSLLAHKRSREKAELCCEPSGSKQRCEEYLASSCRRKVAGFRKAAKKKTFE